MTQAKLEYLLNGYLMILLISKFLAHDNDFPAF